MSNVIIVIYNRLLATHITCSLSYLTFAAGYLSPGLPLSWFRRGWSLLEPSLYEPHPTAPGCLLCLVLRLRDVHWSTTADINLILATAQDIVTRRLEILD